MSEIPLPAGPVVEMTADATFQGMSVVQQEGQLIGESLTDDLEHDLAHTKPLAGECMSRWLPRTSLKFASIVKALQQRILF